MLGKGRVCSHFHVPRPFLRLLHCADDAFIASSCPSHPCTPAHSIPVHAPHSPQTRRPRKMGAGTEKAPAPPRQSEDQTTKPQQDPASSPPSKQHQRPPPPQDSQRNEDMQAHDHHHQEQQEQQQLEKNHEAGGKGGQEEERQEEEEEPQQQEQHHSPSEGQGKGSRADRGQPLPIDPMLLFPMPD